MAGKSNECKNSGNPSPEVTREPTIAAKELHNDLTDNNNAKKQEKNIFKFKYIVSFGIVLFIGFMLGKTDNYKHTEMAFTINNTTIKITAQGTKDWFYQSILTLLKQVTSTENSINTYTNHESDPSSQDSTNPQNDEINPTPIETENLPDAILKLLQQVFKDERKNNSQEVSEAAKTMEKTINKVKYDVYEENNLCDVNKGVKVEDFNSTVYEIAEFLNLPDRLANVIIRAAKFKNQKQTSVESKTFKANDGFLYFGKFVIVKTPGNTLAFSYSLHGIMFKLSPQSEQSGSIDKDFISFSDDVMAGKVDLDGNLTQYIKKAAIAKEAIDSYKEYYLHKSYEKFMDNCKGQLDMLEGIEIETTQKPVEDVEKKIPDVKEEK